MSKIFIYDAATQEETLRDMTTEELTEFEATVANAQKIENDKAEAKAALLTKLGITEEEAKLLLS